MAELQVEDKKRADEIPMAEMQVEVEEKKRLNMLQTQEKKRTDEIRMAQLEADTELILIKSWN